MKTTRVTSIIGVCLLAVCWYANAVPVNVTDSPYNAVPDDGIDDQAAIQDALDANLDVYVPPGTFDLWDGGLTVPEDCYFHGEGRLLMHFEAPEPVHSETWGGTGTNYSIENTCLMLNDGVTIEGLLIDKVWADGSYVSGMYCKEKDDITIRDVQISNLGVRYGIHLHETTNVLIEKCHIYDFYNNDGGESAADMIEEQPGGIMLKNVQYGDVVDNVIENMIVGTSALTSHSEMRPEYGDQGYQTDCMTLMRPCSEINIERNIFSCSGEGLDALHSNSLYVADNYISMQYGVNLKLGGTSYSDYDYNYCAAGATGAILFDYITAGYSYYTEYNTFNDTFFDRLGTNWYDGTTAASRFDEDSVMWLLWENVSDLTFYDSWCYDPTNVVGEMFREHSGVTKTSSGTEHFTDGRAPSWFDEKVVMLSGWRNGLTKHYKRDGDNRLLLFAAFAEDLDSVPSLTAVSYSGQSMTKLYDVTATEGDRRNYLCVYYLKESGINSATMAGSFSPTWNSTPDAYSYNSIFLGNINQNTTFGDYTTTSATSGTSLTGSAFYADTGDFVALWGLAANQAKFTPENGFEEDKEIVVNSPVTPYEWLFSSSGEADWSDANSFCTDTVSWSSGQMRVVWSNITADPFYPEFTDWSVPNIDLRPFNEAIVRLTLDATAPEGDSFRLRARNSSSGSTVNINFTPTLVHGAKTYTATVPSNSLSSFDQFRIEAPIGGDMDDWEGEGYNIDSIRLSNNTRARGVVGWQTGANANVTPKITNEDPDSLALIAVEINKL